MTPATDKQKWLMDQLKITYTDQTSVADAIEMIKAKKGETLLGNKPKVETVIPADKPKNGFKGGFDSATMYVSYAKDLCIAIIEADKPRGPTEVISAMKLSIDLIKDAKEAFS